MIPKESKDILESDKNTQEQDMDVSKKKDLSQLARKQKIKNTINTILEKNFYKKFIPSQAQLRFGLFVFIVRIFDTVYMILRTIVVELFSSLSLDTQNHNPKELVRLLKNFTRDTPIKCTTHSWEGSCESCGQLDFDDFIYKVRQKWDEIKDELYALSPNLHKKIEAFIFCKDPNIWCKENKKLNIGWSNQTGLKEHCNSGGKPFEYVLKDPIDIEDETLTTFKEIVGKFKRKIEVRNDGNMLKSIFVKFRSKLKKDKLRLKICSSLEGADFYSDVEKLKGALDLVFSGIVAKKDDDDIVDIKLKKPNPKSAEDTEYIEVHLVHLNSSSKRTAQEMLLQVDDGDFKEIKENLTNLCDWSIEDSTHEKGYRVNYLNSTAAVEIELLDYKPDGFTYILRFYT